MDIVIAEFKGLHVPTTIAEKISAYNKTWEEEDHDEALWEEEDHDEAFKEIVKALEDKTISVFDIQHILESFHDFEVEDNGIVEDIRGYISSVFRQRKFYKFNLKSSTPEEAAIELLKQTKPHRA